MASISRASLTPNPNLHLPVLSPRPSFFNPQISTLLKPPPPKTLILPLPPIRASQNPNPTPSQTLLSAFVKPTFIALAAAAALFLFRHPKPSLAAAAETLTQPEAAALTDELNEQTLESHLDSNPTDDSALRALMELKVKLQKFPEAIAVVDRLIELDPEDNDLPLLKAHLQTYSGDFESAKLGFELILSKNPYLVEAYHGLVMTVSQSGEKEEVDEIMKRVESALEKCRKEKRSEELRDFRLLVAQVRVMEGKYGEALKVYQELVKEEPRDFRPYLCQGIIYTLMRKKNEAEKQFEKYRRLVPKGHPYAKVFDRNMNAMKGLSAKK